MNKKDLIASVSFLIIAVALFTYASTFPVKAGVSLVLSPGFYPRLLSALLALLSILLMFESLKKKPEAEDCPPPVKKKALFKTKGGMLFLLTLGMLILYPFCLEYLGFAIAAFLFIFVMIAALSENFKKNALIVFIISLAITVVMVLVFKVFLHIPFPEGILF